MMRKELTKSWQSLGFLKYTIRWTRHQAPRTNSHFGQVQCTQGQCSTGCHWENEASGSGCLVSWDFLQDIISVTQSGWQSLIRSRLLTILKTAYLELWDELYLVSACHLRWLKPRCMSCCRPLSHCGLLNLPFLCWGQVDPDVSRNCI